MKSWVIIAGMLLALTGCEKYIVKTLGDDSVFVGGTQLRPDLPISQGEIRRAQEALASGTPETVGKGTKTLSFAPTNEQPL